MSVQTRPLRLVLSHWDGFTHANSHAFVFVYENKRGKSIFIIGEVGVEEKNNEIPALLSPAISLNLYCSVATICTALQLNSFASNK